jgi:hypothetical protein
MTTAIVPVQDIERMALAIAGSGLFGMKTKEQAIALMLVAQSEGLHPARAAMEYHVIQGRPALKADAMLSRFQAAGGKVEWHDYTPEKVSATFSHAQGGSIRIEWTRKMADDAKLTSKETWRQYPRQMLRARVISEGIRTVFPGVAVGIYTPEEVGDFVREEKNMGAAEIVTAASVGVSDVGEVIEPYDYDAAVDQMREAVREAQLKAVFAPAWKRAKADGDGEMGTVLKIAYDECKAKFSDKEGTI